MIRRVLFALTALSLSAALGCDGCSEPLSKTDTTDDDRNPLPTDGTDPTEEAKEPRDLALVGQSPLTVYRNQASSVRFALTGQVNRLPVAGATITVETTGTAATVTGTTFTTGTDGTITVPFTAGAADGNVTITARAVDVDNTIDQASVLVQVVEDPAARLKITVSSMARIPVTRASAAVYVATTPPTCATLLATTTLPNPNFTADYAQVPGSQSFNNQPTGKKVTALVDGYNAGGFLVARGCVEGAPLVGGIENQLAVVLGQGTTDVTGDYDVLMHAALGQALPAPYDVIVDNVSGVLSDPAGFALFFVFQQADLPSVTGIEATDTYGDIAANPTAYPLWNSLRGSLDARLATSLGQTYVDVTDVGAGLRDVITDFEIGARLELTNGTGNGALNVHESWRDIVVFWPLPCADGDMSCARIPLSMADVQLGAVDSRYGATYVQAAVQGQTERFAVTTAPHGVNLNYGALILAVMNQAVFPNLPASIRADNLSGVLHNVVDCADIGAAVGGQSTSVVTLVNLFCDVGLTAASTFAENQLLQLNVDAVNPELGQAGLAGGGTFVLLDANQDLKTDTVRDYVNHLGWNDPNNAAATQDIDAPITGDGQRARTACATDGQCTSTEACVPRPSYLKIAEVSLGCERSVGSLAGGATCTADNQCASGLCDPVGVAGARVCFESCNITAANASSVCATGLGCSAIGASMNLDTTLMGLGDVAIPGCAAP